MADDGDKGIAGMKICPVCKKVFLRGGMTLSQWLRRSVCSAGCVRDGQKGWRFGRRPAPRAPVPEAGCRFYQVDNDPAVCREMRRRGTSICLGICEKGR